MLSHSARDASFYGYREKETDIGIEMEVKRKRGVDVDRERVSQRRRTRGVEEGAAQHHNGGRGWRRDSTLAS